MTYESRYTGSQVDDAVARVRGDNVKVKYGNIIGNVLDQEDLAEALDKKQEAFKVGKGLKLEEGTLSTTGESDATWGKIEGDITEQEDLLDLLGTYQKKLTAPERAAVDSGITVDKVLTYDNYEYDIASKASLADLSSKADISNTLAGYFIEDAYTKQQIDDNYQKKLTAGKGITITPDNEISSAGDGSWEGTMAEYEAAIEAGEIPADTTCFVDDGASIIPVASENNLGLVKPDGTSITIDENGTIHSTGGSGGGSWGTITGDIETQTDLVNKFATKADDNAVVHLANNETVTGSKTFINTGNPIRLSYDGSSTTRPSDSWRPFDQQYGTSTFYRTIRGNGAYPNVCEVEDWVMHTEGDTYQIRGVSGNGGIRLGNNNVQLDPYGSFDSGDKGLVISQSSVKFYGKSLLTEDYHDSTKQDLITEDNLGVGLKKEHAAVPITEDDYDLTEGAVGLDGYGDYKIKTKATLSDTGKPFSIKCAVKGSNYGSENNVGIIYTEDDLFKIRAYGVSSGASYYTSFTLEVNNNNVWVEGDSRVLKEGEEAELIFTYDGANEYVLTVIGDTINAVATLTSDYKVAASKLIIASTSNRAQINLNTLDVEYDGASIFAGGNYDLFSVKIDYDTITVNEAGELVVNVQGVASGKLDLDLSNLNEDGAAVINAMIDSKLGSVETALDNLIGEDI